MKKCDNDFDYCTEKFDLIEKRLNVKSDMLDRHGIAIEVIKTDMSHLTQSLNALTKALWGVAVTTLATLLSFFMWYVQNR